jgi:hypothetical protein
VPEPIKAPHTIEGGPKAGGGLKGSLTKKLGPLPTWAWIGGGGLVVWFVLSRGKRGGLGAGTGQFAQPGQGGGGGGASPLPPVNPWQPMSGVSPAFLGGGGGDPPPPFFPGTPPAPVFSFASVAPQTQPQVAGIQTPPPQAPVSAPVGYAPSGLFYAGGAGGAGVPGIVGPVPGTPFQGLFAPTLASTPAAPQYATPQYASVVGGPDPSTGAQYQTLSVYGLPTAFSLDPSAIARGGIPANQTPNAIFMPNSPAASNAPGGGYWGPNNVNRPPVA